MTERPVGDADRPRWVRTVRGPHGRRRSVPVGVASRQRGLCLVIRRADAGPRPISTRLTVAKIGKLVSELILVRDRPKVHRTRPFVSLSPMLPISPSSRWRHVPGRGHSDEYPAARLSVRAQVTEGPCHLTGNLTGNLTGKVAAGALVEQQQLVTGMRSRHAHRRRRSLDETDPTGSNDSCAGRERSSS